MQVSRKAYRAECNAEFQFNASNRVAVAITNAAHHHESFSKRDVLSQIAHRDRFVSRAVASLLEQAERAGAIRSIGKDVWAVIGEEELCEVVLRHAA